MCYVESLRFYVAMETMGGVAVPRWTNCSKDESDLCTYIWKDDMFQILVISIDMYN